MKFVMDDRLKHRLTGLIVIASIIAIFIPAMVKKSNQHLEDSISVAVHLPAKPTPPKVTIKDADTLFKTVKVAHVDIPPVVAKETITRVVKAEPLSIKSAIPAVAKTKVNTKVEIAAVPIVRKPAPMSKKPLAVASIAKKDAYAVQLASFSQKSNAQSLMNRLRSHGYKATYVQYQGKNGALYKVVVGKLREKEQAKLLQRQLASNMQLKGFVVKTEVS